MGRDRWQKLRILNKLLKLEQEMVMLCSYHRSFSSFLLLFELAAKQLMDYFPVKLLTICSLALLKY